MALAAGLWLAPAPPLERLAAAQAGSLLSETAEGLDGPLWKALARGPGLVRLGESRLLIEGVEAGEPSGQAARSSVVRALRSSLADDDAEGLDITVLEEEGPGAVRLVTRVADGTLSLTIEADGAAPVSATRSWQPARRSSLFPPLIAICLAILLRRPVVALFAGVLLGAMLVRFSGGAGVVMATVGGGFDVFARYFRAQLVDSFRLEIIVFVILMLSMVGVITRIGGIRGVMDSISQLASDVKRTQLATFLMGLAIFFDDYANTILVGSTMRPLTDRFKIAREKLAFIVDSTAAPVAGISIFSTWIAFEVSTFSAQLPAAQLAPSDGYSVFMQTLPYRFYCLFTLVFVGAVVLTGRDFGPMRRAELRARGGKVLRDGARPMVGAAATNLEPAPSVTPRARSALLPLGAFVGVTLFEILRSGGGLSMGTELFTLEGAAQVLYDGSGSTPLMIGSLVGLLLAALIGLIQGLRGEIVGAAWASLRSMGIAIVILYLAWMIGGVCDDLGTAPYLSALLGEHLPALALPMILFLLAGVIAFSTGSSWSTMTILLPLVIGLAFSLGEGAPIGGHLLMILSIGAVLEGSIFGDHCSPLSDTTVMSSIASASDHIDHVRTQAPYALTTMLGAMLLGYLPSVLFGLENRPWLPYVCLAGGSAVLVGFLYVFGKKTDASAG